MQLAFAYEASSFVRYGREARIEVSPRQYLRMPADHIEFYKQTIIRLIQAGEMSPAAVNQFDFAFKLKT